MYALQNNVEIISGAKKYCIYNLNSGKMYSADSEAITYLNEILSGKAEKVVSPEFISYLLDNDILVVKGKEARKILEIHDQIHIDFAWIEITQNCNLICRHCYEGSSRADCRPEMSFEDFQFAIETLKKIGIDRIQLVGGEPLTHTKLCRFIDYVANKFSFIEIFTNGTLLTDSLLKKIKEAGISLAFSVYSENSRFHDYVTRTSGSFEKTYTNIKKAMENGIEVRTASVEMKEISDTQIISFNVPHRTDLPRLTGRANLSLYNRDMLRRKLITKETFKQPIVPEQFYRNKIVHNCFGNHLYIDCNLSVYPCAMERRVQYGNLRTTDKEELLHNPLRTMTKDKIDGCKDCEYRYACYDCRCDTNNASIQAKPWYCTYDPLQGIWEDVDTFIDGLLLSNSNKSEECES